MIKQLKRASQLYPSGFTMKSNGVYAKEKSGYFVALTDNRIRRIDKKALSCLFSNSIDSRLACP